MATFSSTAQHALRAAQVLGSVSAVLCALILAIAFIYRLYHTPQQRLLVQIAVASLAFGVSGATTYPAIEVDVQDPSYICGVWSAFDSCHIAVVVFEITYTTSLLFSMAKRCFPVAFEVPLVVVGWLAALVNAVWFGTRCVHEFSLGLLNGLDWFWDTSRTENFFPIALISVDILFCLWALFRYIQHRNRLQDRRKDMDFELQFMPEHQLRQLSLVNLEERSLRELVAPIKMFPLSFICFSVVYIIAAVALSHTATDTHWVNIAMFMYMAMSFRGIVFFIVYFWHPTMRELLRPANFWARCRRRRIVRHNSAQVRFPPGALVEHLLPEDHQQHTRAMGPRGDGELEPHDSAYQTAGGGGNNGQSPRRPRARTLFTPLVGPAVVDAEEVGDMPADGLADEHDEPGDEEEVFLVTNRADKHL